MKKKIRKKLNKKYILNEKIRKKNTKKRKKGR